MNKFLNVTEVLGGTHRAVLINSAEIVSINSVEGKTELSNVSLSDGKSIQVAASLAWLESQLPN